MPKTYGGKFWDELMVGQEVWTGGRTVAEGDVPAFSGLTGDFNPLHVDEEFARTSDTVHARVVVRAKRKVEKRDRGIVTFAVTLFNQRDEPVQEGEHVLLSRVGRGDPESEIRGQVLRSDIKAERLSSMSSFARLAGSTGTRR